LVHRRGPWACSARAAAARIDSRPRSGGRRGRAACALTRERAKPALPFGGGYRLIDFPLSNCHHSRISDVWVLQQYEAHSLSEYLSNGRPWDLDRTYGGLRVVQPYLGDDESGWYEGNADAIQSNREAIERFQPELVLALSADAVYRLDYAAVVDRHLETGAELTMVTTRVAADEAHRFGVVERGRDGRAKAFAYKPENPTGDLVTTECSSMTRGCCSTRSASSPAGRRHRTSATACSLRLSSAAAHGRSTSTDTGATSARWTAIGTRTWTC
jgi:NDP-sugar pyrophosphorylase family protein